MLVTAAVAADAAEHTIPERKAGLWELITTMDEGLGPKTQTLTMCIDADMEHMTVVASNDEHRQQCSKYDIVREGDNTIVNMSCQFASRQVVSKTEMTGDFSKSLSVKIESSTSGDHNGQSVTVKRTITQTGNYLGENCGDLAAGEAKGTDGSRIVVQ
ncbi:DUF3617 domain-containing protein [Hyphomicrobium sp.]|uniref:DUF3617 domain-containing protein n=1 Tax=Hyphomicrobium sp. TaxID=82 RepID=UPI003F707457